MCNDRNVHKTIRLSQENYDYINKLSGDSWNDKFNNAIYEIIHGEEKIKQSLERIQKQIDEKQQQLTALDNVIKEAKKTLGINSYWQNTSPGAAEAKMCSLYIK